MLGMKPDTMLRNTTLDAAKGLAIILVVFGHSIQRNMADNTDLWYWAAIHHFHMALFMFIAGYLAYGKLDSGWLSRRFLQLIPPYIAWSFILYYWSTFPFSGLGEIYPTKGGPVMSFLSITASLNLSGLWFFPALFALCTALYLVKGRPKAIIALTVVAYAISQLPFPTGYRFLNSAMSRIAWFMPFYAFGYFVSQYRNELRSLDFLKWFALIAFPVFFVLGHGTTNVQPIYTWGKYTVFMSSDILLPLYRFVMSLLGIGMTFAVLALIIKVAAIRRTLCYFGFITLGIYAAHPLWLKIGIGSGFSMAL
jgi:fucose 4-O-acetylase-like acetyltransferase